MYRQVLIAGMAVALQACSVSSTKQNVPNVTSTPSGADVYANGLKIGETPLKTDLYKAFPASWIDWVYQATGVLMVKKPGCQDFVLKVNDYILSQPINAKLVCDGSAQAVTPEPAKKVESVPAQSKPEPASVEEGSIEARLQKLDKLYKKGLVTQEEYRATRKRILEAL